MQNGQKDDICLDIYYLLRYLRLGLSRFMSVLEPCDPSGNLLNLNPFRNCTRNQLRFFFYLWKLLAHLTQVGVVGVAEGVHDGLEDRFQNLRVAIYIKIIHKKNSGSQLKNYYPLQIRVLSKRLSVPAPPFYVFLSPFRVPNQQLLIEKDYFISLKSGLSLSIVIVIPIITQ